MSDATRRLGRCHRTRGVMVELETAFGAQETWLIGPVSATGERFVPLDVRE